MGSESVKSRKKIALIGGDGIGPTIAIESQRVLEYLLRDQVRSGKVEFRIIEGLTIENRAKHLKSIPDDVLAELRRREGISGIDEMALSQMAGRQLPLFSL